MTKSGAWRSLLALFCLGANALAAAGQPSASPCGVPPVVAINAQPNIFSEQQEEWLGDAMAEAVEADFVLVRDPDQNAYLQRIADKLAATLPETKIHFRVRLIDSAEVNGFSIAGGRIYLTRKLAASARTDDELASVIGHEIGHIASHQFAFETTRDLKRMLGITSVGDRADIFTKFQLLTEARTRAKSTSSHDDDDKQGEADRVGIYAIAAAGYRPQANPEFWDRMFFTQGRKGGTLSNFFGITKPEERRLGSLSKMVAALPPGCGGQEPVRQADFEAWHKRVLENRSVFSAAAAGIEEVPLSPALRMDLDRLRFSPDGRYVLAQDESSIFVMSRDNLKVLLQTEASGALPAQFSPDSQRLVFTTQGLHTEEWDIAAKKLIAVHEPLAKSPCIQAKISPDGRTVICMSFNDSNGYMALSLLNAADGAVVWKKDDFFQPNLFYLYVLLFSNGREWAGDMVPSSFSADGNYLLIGPDAQKLAFDLRTRTPIKLGGALRNDVSGAYAFLGSDRVVGVNNASPKNSGIFSFPDGRYLKKFELLAATLQSVSAVQNPGYAVMDGIRGYQVTVGNLEEGHLVLGSYTPAVDLWGSKVAYEEGDGSVVLRDMPHTEGSKDERLKLPLSDLSELRAAAMSPNGKLLAISTRSRGAVWNLHTGAQVLRVPGFQDAKWATDGVLYVEFPKRGKEDPKMLVIDVSTGKGKLAPYAMDKMTMNFGLLYEWRDLKKSGKEIVFRDVADGKDLWSKQFPDGTPGFTASLGEQDVLFSNLVNTSYAKAALKTDPKLAREAGALLHKESGRLIEAVAPKTGTTLGQVVVEVPGEYTGANGLTRVGDLLYVTSNGNRTVVYSMEDGRQVRQLYGTVAAVDLGTGRVCMHDQIGVLQVYDAHGVALARIETSKLMRYVRFTADGSRVMLVGADQIVRTASATGPAKVQNAAAGVATAPGTTR